MNKRVFGWFEVVFDGLYLCAALALGIIILRGVPGNPAFPGRELAGAMALILAAGDAFHLIPRMAAILAGGEKRFAKAMGFGKLVASLTMTVFYVLLWHLGLALFTPALAPWVTTAVHLAAAIRIILCLFPQNRWLKESPPVNWAVYRNIPFLLLGIAVAALFAGNAATVPAVSHMGLAIALSFAFYLPVALFAGKNRKLGMLMLPKTLMYLWMLCMCAALGAK